MFFQCFHVRIVKHIFASLAKSATQLHQHDALQGAHVPNLLLCVAFGAHWFGYKNHSFCERSKYVVFSIVICIHDLQTTVCVAPRARCGSVPSGVLGDTLATPAARSRPEICHEPDLPGFEPPRPPRSTPDMLNEARRQRIPTTKVVSSVVG